MTATITRKPIVPFSGKPSATPRVAIFVDGASLFHMQRNSLGWFIDPRKLLNYLSKYGDIVDANYYAGVDPENLGQVNFLRALGHMGYTVEQQNLSDSFDQYTTVDIKMMLQIVTQSDNYDVAILVTGEYGFTEPLSVINSRGKKFIVMGDRKNTSSYLRNMAGINFVDLADLRKQLEKLS